ncbi:MAG TPA: ABC transporter permease [Candidatus Borkfalkia avistercoris]|uniref:ABC transporter permease n=1 Tax=Candidatus Borkfalkia avistercoris TaxID=2838504 RepID=A0A9D2A777_9FIRM|nr:ABC transporter permease [Candidatus Borkfalkia avistercoris]
MNNILTVIKKEFARFFKDKRLVIGTLLLPGVLIFVLYTLLGSVFYDPNEAYSVLVVHPSASFSALFGEYDSFSLAEIAEDEEEAAKERVKSGEADLLVVLPENFDELLASGGTSPVGQAPNVEIWYDSSSVSSSSAYGTVVSLLDALEDSVSNRFDVNISAGGDLTTAQEAEASYYAMLLPFLILTFLYSGCMGIAPESIAGEKERGTIATLLVTPIKRSQLVIGKIASLSVLSALSAISSFIGTFLAMPRLMGGNIGDAFAAYSAGQFVALFAVMLSAVLIIVSLISIISAYAKSVKEAASLSVPLMILVMLVGLSTMFFTPASPAVFFIPIYNCVQVMAQIFSLRFSAISLLITLASNLVYIALLVWALTKMFKSEKVIFNN